MDRVQTGLLLLAIASCAAQAQGMPSFDPERPCPGFKPNDLSFPLPRSGPVPEVKSAPFFAVILRTAERCSIQERERKEVQALFVSRKVFYTRFECDDDAENNVTYSNVNPKVGFLAVYAAQDRAAAEAFLAEVKASARFPGANLRRMQAVFVSP